MSKENIIKFKVTICEGRYVKYHIEDRDGRLTRNIELKKAAKLEIGFPTKSGAEYFANRLETCFNTKLCYDHFFNKAVYVNGSDVYLTPSNYKQTLGLYDNRGDYMSLNCGPGVKIANFRSLLVDELGLKQYSSFIIIGINDTLDILPNLLDKKLLSNLAGKDNIYKDYLSFPEKYHDKLLDNNSRDFREKFKGKSPIFNSIINNKHVPQLSDIDDEDDDDYKDPNESLNQNENALEQNPLYQEVNNFINDLTGCKKIIHLKRIHKIYTEKIDKQIEQYQKVNIKKDTILNEIEICQKALDNPNKFESSFPTTNKVLMELSLFKKNMVENFKIISPEAAKFFMKDFFDEYKGKFDNIVLQTSKNNEQLTKGYDTKGDDENDCKYDINEENNDVTFTPGGFNHSATPEGDSENDNTNTELYKKIYNKNPKAAQILLKNFDLWHDIYNEQKPTIKNIYTWICESSGKEEDDTQVSLNGDDSNNSNDFVE